VTCPACLAAIERHVTPDAALKAIESDILTRGLRANEQAWCTAKGGRRRVMTFGEAIEQAKQGERIRREGWNGKGMWVAFGPGSAVAPDEIAIYFRRLSEPKVRIVEDFFVMFTARGTLQPGWLASQADMLADDWQVVEASE